MGEGRRATATLICLACFLHFGTPMAMAFAAAAAAEPRKNTEQTTWCVVKPSTSFEKLDELIDYCCTQPGVDCSVIQAGGLCYFPPNKVSDASVVMNIFYNLNGKHPFNCYFKGNGLVVTQDPSVGKCVYPA